MQVFQKKMYFGTTFLFEPKCVFLIYYFQFVFYKPKFRKEVGVKIFVDGY